MMVDTLNPFTKKVTEDALAHAKEMFPKESCGLVVDGNYVSCENKAQNPDEDFEIDSKVVANALKSGKLTGVWHSHTQGQNAPSKADMKSQISMNLPWGIHVLEEGAEGPNFVNTLTMGDHVLKAPLEERVWVSGVYDCVNLVRSYYFQTKKLILPDFARDIDWWDQGQNAPLVEVLPLYEKQFEVLPPQALLQKDDIVLMALRSTYPNHMGVMVEDEVILHHQIASLSAYRPFVTLQATVVKVLRLKR